MTQQTLDANPKALARIKHIVVLMLENRSFDNLLGWLYDAEAPPRGQAFEGLNDGLWCPFANADDDGTPFIEQVYVRRNGHAPRRGPTPGYLSKWVTGYGPSATIPNWLAEQLYPLDYTLPNPDPGEGYGYTNLQLFQSYRVADLETPVPTNAGFVEAYAAAIRYYAYSLGFGSGNPRDIMACYTPEQVPVLSELARSFAVCDQWYSSLPSETLPNRDFVHAATSTGYVNTEPDSLCDAKTIFNQLQEAIDGGRTDLSWRVYCSNKSDDNTRLAPLTRIALKQLHPKVFDPNFESIDEFYKHASDGTLPSYAFLEPQMGGPQKDDQHPPGDIRPGEHLIAKVYRAVLDSPSWDETLLVVTYDEHGGCYDHVPPPNNAWPPDATSPYDKGPDAEPGVPGQHGFRFNRFGVRVPTVVVSPLVQAGTIARPSGSTPFDHTSIIATVRNCFGLEGSLTARDANAPDLSCLLTLDVARKDKPAVQPLSLPDSGDTPTTDLEYQCARAMKKLMGRSPTPDQSVHDYVHDAYAHHFGDSRDTGSSTGSKA